MKDEESGFKPDRLPRRIAESIIKAILIIWVRVTGRMPG